MSKAMQVLKDFLSVSPSVVFPDEVLELLEQVERENDELKADNAKLRERVKEQGRTIRAYRDKWDDLRELCADMLHDAMENVCSKAYWCSEKSWQTCNDKSCGNNLYVEMAHELGIEVDG